MTQTQIFPADKMQTAALQLATPIVLALMECDDELRQMSVRLFQQLHSGELDEYEQLATTALLAEILFPNSDDRGYPGLDPVEAEQLAPSQNPDAGPVLAQMDEQERAFAVRLRDCMDRQGVTQTELAEKLGVGQPAISMMLNRTCRPQQKTVRRCAEALGVPPADLWPGIDS